LATVGWLVFGALLLYFALRQVDLRQIWLILSRAHIGYVCLALISVILNSWGKAVRWQVMLAPDTSRVRIDKTLAALTLGQTMNWFVPGRVGELGRAYVIGQFGPGRSFALGTIVLEKILDLFCYLLVFILTLVLAPLPEIVSNSGYVVTAMTLVSMAAVFAVAGNLEACIHLLRRVLRFLPTWIVKFTAPRVEAAMQSLNIVGRGRDMIRLGLWSCLIWGTALWTNHLAMLALGVHMPILASLALLVVILAGVSVPSVPGKFGVFQYLCILTLSLFKIDPATGLSYGILLQAIVFLPATIYSLIAIVFMGIRPGSENGSKDAGTIPTQ
jgi:uncharacterized protein (TIRG00374 family)